MKNLTVKAFGGLLSVLVAMGALLFLSAWTLNYWQAWVFLAMYGVSWFVITVYLMKKDPKLLERRLPAGPTAEQRTSQKVIVSLASMEFVALLVFCALDHRFGWTSMPPYLSVVGNVLSVLGWVIIFFVLKENTYASATIEVMADQKVITTGPYAIVRHPMYSGFLLYLLGIPIALGSWWGLLVLFLITFTLLWRLFDEEDVLKKSLPGYREYMQKVHYRLIPYVW